MNKVSVAKIDKLKDRKPEYALVGEVDLVVVPNYLMTDS